MPALGIRYLTGYAAATDASDYAGVEWPPHPARVFMALVAAHHEANDASSSASQRLALNWLEKQNPPAVYAGEAEPRTPVTSYVPVNDDADPIKWDAQKQKHAFRQVSGPLPIGRNRQARFFPRAWLVHDTVHLVWPDAVIQSEEAEGLAALCDKVTRIGHSSSLVQMAFHINAEDVAPGGRHLWTPDPIAPDIRLRQTNPGLLEYLETQHGEANRAAHQTLASDIAAFEEQKKQTKGKGSRERKAEIQEHIDALKNKQDEMPPPRPPIRPALSLASGYRRMRPRQGEALAHSCFDSRLIVLRLRPKESDFRWLGLLSTQTLMQALRRAMIARSEQVLGAVPTFISGHEADGRPTDRPHLAYLPLSFVGHKHADGHMLGVAVALPRALARPEQEQVMETVNELTQHGLTLGRLGAWGLDSVLRDELAAGSNLRAERWTAEEGGARAWASVTPMVYDRHPKHKDPEARDTELTRMLARTCQRTGLPNPARCRFTPISSHIGTPPSHAFGNLSRKNGSKLGHSHVLLEFDQPVIGPVLLGAGRFRGYGLFRPIPSMGDRS